MSDEQRNQARERWQRFQQLPPADQARVRDSFRRFQQLPPERRELLRQQWRNATPAQREQMIERARAHGQQRPMSGGHFAPHSAPPPHH